MADLLEGFQDLDEFYPGSKQRRRESQEQRHARRVEERRIEREERPWDYKPVEVWVNGVKYDMFRIGALAKALNRDPITIRAWIRKRWLPGNHFQTKQVYGSLGNAGRRLWTRDQIEFIVSLAEQEGLFKEKPPYVKDTQFTRRIFAAWPILMWQ